MTPERTVLATLAAHGILNHDSVRDMPDSFTLDQITDRCDLDTAGVRTALDSLKCWGYVRKRNTGYYGYGDHYVEGRNVWSITPKGLVALWA